MIDRYEFIEMTHAVLQDNVHGYFLSGLMNGKYKEHVMRDENELQKLDETWLELTKYRHEKL